MTDARVCPDCSGAGMVGYPPEEQCAVCHGTGKVEPDEERCDGGRHHKCVHSPDEVAGAWCGGNECPRKPSGLPTQRTWGCQCPSSSAPEPCPCRCHEAGWHCADCKEPERPPDEKGDCPDRFINPPLPPLIDEKPAERGPNADVFGPASHPADCKCNLHGGPQDAERGAGEDVRQIRAALRQLSMPSRESLAANEAALDRIVARLREDERTILRENAWGHGWKARAEARLRCKVEGCEREPDFCNPHLIQACGDSGERRRAAEERAEKAERERDVLLRYTKEHVPADSIEGQHLAEELRREAEGE